MYTLLSIPMYINSSYSTEIPQSLYLAPWGLLISKSLKEGLLEIGAQLRGVFLTIHKISNGDYLFQL